MKTRLRRYWLICATICVNAVCPQSADAATKTIQILTNFNQTGSLADVVHLGDNQNDSRFLPPNPSRTTRTFTFQLDEVPSQSAAPQIKIDQYQADNSVLQQRSFVQVNGVSLGFLSHNPGIQDLSGATQIPVLTDTFPVDPALLHQGANTVTVVAGDVGIGPPDTYDDFCVTNIRFVYTVFCPVGPLTTQHMNEPAYDESFLGLDLRQALSCFRDAASALGGRVVPTSGYRPTEYQAHLYELRTKFIELSNVNGIIPYVVGRRPQLATTPGTIACQEIVDAVNDEIRRHGLVARTDGTPAVAPPGTSLHELGRAVDLNVSGLPQNVSGDRLARNCGLYRPYPVNDPVHYELTGESPRRQLTFTGNSPINILVEDPTGRRIGFDTASNAVVNQIGQYATYSGTGSTPQVIQIFPNEVRPGGYIVTGVGTGTGAYSVSVRIASEDGSGSVAERILAVGMASAGQSLPTIPPINCVLNSMTLQAERLGQDLLLLAPPWATNVVVESSSNLIAWSWTELVHSIDPTNGFVLTNLPPGSVFFRLRAQ